MPFDPYWEWLKVPRDRRPPTCYDLLGLEPGENDIQRIRRAASDRYALVRAYAAGPRGEQAHRILSELAAAVVSLVDSDSSSHRCSAQATEPDSGSEPGKPKGEKNVEEVLAEALSLEELGSPRALAEQCLDRYLETADPSLLEGAEQLAVRSDPRHGFHRFMRSAVRRGVNEAAYRRQLEADARKLSCRLCPSCLEFAPLLDPRAVDEVILDKDGTLSSKALSIRRFSGCWTEIRVEGHEIPWPEPQPDVCVSKLGAFIAANLCTTLPLVFVLLAYSWDIPGAESLIALLTTATVLAVTAVGIFYRPAQGTALDAGWQVVVPRLLEQPPDPAAASFIAGLAQASRGRGGASRREPVLADTIRKYHAWTQQGILPHSYLGILYRLAFTDAMRKWRSANKVLEIFIRSLEDCIRGTMPIACLDIACDNSFVLEYLASQVPTRFRYLICETCYAAGYSVADVMLLADRSSAVRRVFDAAPLVDREVVAHWFATLRATSTSLLPMGVVSIVEAARRKHQRALQRWPDILLLSRSGEPVACARGFIYRDKLYRSPPKVTCEETKRFVQTGGTHQQDGDGSDARGEDNPPVGYWEVTGYSLRVGEEAVSYSSDPSATAAWLRMCIEFFFEKIRPMAHDFVLRPVTGRVEAATKSPDLICPHCGATISDGS